MVIEHRPSTLLTSSGAPATKRRRSATIESQGSDDPRPKRILRSQITDAQHSSDDDGTTPSQAAASRPYNLRATNNPNPGKALGVYKRTRDEWLAEQAAKRALKEPSGEKVTKENAPSRGLKKERSTVLSQLTKKYDEEKKKHNAHDVYNPEEPLDDDFSPPSRIPHVVTDDFPMLGK